MAQLSGHLFFLGVNELSEQMSEPSILPAQTSPLLSPGFSHLLVKSASPSSEVWEKITQYEVGSVLV